jgi:DNA-binding transcriptional regulator YiaG
MGSGYHLAMPTQSTNQILLKLQPRQSSDKIKTTQAGNQIKAQVSQPPMPFPQIKRRTGHQTVSRTQRTREISPENLTLGDDHTNKISSRIQQMRLTRLETHLNALIKQLRTKSKLKPKDFTRATLFNVTLSLT